MFCGKCGKQMKDDMVFCPYCGTTINSEDAANVEETKTEKAVNVGEVKTEEAKTEKAVSVEVAGQSNSIFDTLNERDFYNSLHVDITDLPDISGEYLVLGSERLLLSEIVEFQSIKQGGTGLFTIIDKNGKRMELEIAGIRKVSSKLKYAGALYLAFKGPSVINEKRLTNFIMQQVRIAPLCGDEAMKRKGRIVSEIMSTKANESKKQYGCLRWDEFQFYMYHVGKFEKDEYPIYVKAGLFATNKKIIIDVNGVNIYKYGENEIPPMYLHNEVIMKIKQYYEQGRIEEFIEKEYKPNSGILKYKLI